MNRFTKYIWIVLVALATGCSKGEGGGDGSVSGGVPGIGGDAPDVMVSMTLDLSAAGRLTAARLESRFGSLWAR